MLEIPQQLRFFPAVFAVNDTYQIIVSSHEETVAAIRVGDNVYYDDANGILRSRCYAHKIEVPMAELDAVCEYAVILRKVTDRSEPHAPRTEPLPDAVFSFRPASGKDTLNVYHLSDVHNYDDAAIKAGRYWEDTLDLLILNGDIPNHSGRVEKFDTVYHIISELTHGSIPCVFARGNHDTRGAAAEEFGDYTPTSNGKTYYTFRIGALWGLVLDCGEDKSDDHPEYGGTVCFHAFRKKETDFIKSIIKSSASEYEAEGVKYRLVVCHVPFTYIQEPPFDIEQDLYSEWARLLREHIKPDLMLHGHMHVAQTYRVGGKHDNLGQPCTAIIGSALKRWTETDDEGNKIRKCAFTGCALTLDMNKKTAHIVFNNDAGETLSEQNI